MIYLYLVHVILGQSPHRHLLQELLVAGIDGLLEEAPLVKVLAPQAARAVATVQLRAGASPTRTLAIGNCLSLSSSSLLLHHRRQLGGSKNQE